MRFMILFVIALILMICQLPAQSTYSVQTITTNGSAVYDISDSGSVVYKGYADGDAQLFLYKNGSTTQITSNTGGTHFIDYVKININDQIVWNQYDYRPAGGLDVNLYLYSGGVITKINTLIGTTDNVCIEPRINNAGQVVWRQYDAEGMNAGVEVFFYDGSTHRLTTNADKETDASLNDNGFVVWSGDQRSHLDWNTRIYLYNGSDISIIAFDPVAGFLSPQISNDNSIVYVRYNSNESYYYSLYLYAGSPALKVTDTSYNYLRPFHYKNGKLLIVKNDLHIYQYTTGSWVKISPDTTDDNHPVGNGSFITWVDYNLIGNWRVNVHDGVMINNLTGYGSFSLPLVDTRGDVIWADGAWIYMASRWATSIEQHPQTPQSYILSQNYPNPFNPATIIHFSLPQGRNTIVRVYDVLGKEITTLTNGFLPAGEHSVEFNADALGLQSGVYFYRLQAGNFAETKKMMMVK